MTIEEARALAEAFASANGLQIAPDLIDGDAIADHPYYPIYHLIPDFPAGWWVTVAIDPWSPPVLMPSTSLGISKLTGAVQILGSARDEG